MSETFAHTKYDMAIQDNWVWIVNGQQAEDDVADYLSETSAFEPIQRPCEYCGTMMAFSVFSETPTWENDQNLLSRSYALACCPHCAHWTFQGHEGNGHCMDAPATLITTSVAGRYDDAIPEGCTEELAQYLRRHPQAWHSMSPRSLELLVADVWRANHSGCEVMHVGKPGDLGIDVIFVDQGKRTWLIQVKRRSHPGKAESFSTLQSMLGTLALEGKRHGIIVTTADYFSYHAERQCGKAMRRGYVVELVDKGILDRMLSAVMPNCPWLDLFRNSVFQGLDGEAQKHLMAGMPDLRQAMLFT